MDPQFIGLIPKKQHERSMPQLLGGKENLKIFISIYFFIWGFLLLTVSVIKLLMFYSLNKPDASLNRLFLVI